MCVILCKEVLHSIIIDNIKCSLKLCLTQGIVSTLDRRKVTHHKAVTGSDVVTMSVKSVELLPGSMLATISVV